MSWSGSFSPILTLRPEPSRLQLLALGGLAGPLTAVPLVLPLDWSLRLPWLVCHVAAGLWEAWRCGLLGTSHRLRSVARYRRQWTLEFADGRMFSGELRRCWVSAACAYLEVGGDALKSRPVLIWRDSLSAEEFRHLRVHLRIS